MNKPAHPRRWFSGWRAVRRPAEDDAADYGTAFGLDMSLPGPDTDLPAPAAKPPLDWRRRLAGLRKPAL
jgi:hypothetical protein